MQKGPTMPRAQIACRHAQVQHCSIGQSERAAAQRAVQHTFSEPIEVSPTVVMITTSASRIRLRTGDQSTLWPARPAESVDTDRLLLQIVWRVSRTFSRRGAYM